MARSFRTFLGISFVISVLLAAQCYSAEPTSSCHHDSQTFRCVKFVKAYDGDTFTVDIPGVHPLIGQGISVRVAGIDTPEIRGGSSCEKQVARQARDLVVSILKSAKRIDLTDVKKDKYFRIVATPVVDGVPLGQVLLKRELAYSYDGGTKKKVDWCERTPAGKKSRP